mgnify:CR=1 FL=1
MEKHISQMSDILTDIVDHIRPTIRYAMHQIYISYEEIGTYIFPPKKGLVIYMNYNFINNIYIQGEPIQWTVRSNDHPLEGKIASSEDAIEIRYRNIDDFFRYIVPEDSNIEEVCTYITNCVNDRREKQLITYAHYIDIENDIVDITIQLNEYILPEQYTDIITIDSFQWDKMYHGGICLANKNIFFRDFNGIEHKKIRV